MNCTRQSFFTAPTWWSLRRGGDRLFHNASSWSKCWDWASEPCFARFPFKNIQKVRIQKRSRQVSLKTCGSLFCGIFEISSMLAETENLRLKRSSTAGMTKFEVRCAYFFCHVYVSSDTSFLSNRLICRLGAGLGSKTCPIKHPTNANPKLNSLSIISLSGAQYVGNFTYFAGVLCKQMIGMYCKSFSSTEILEKSDEGSTFMTG